MELVNSQVSDIDFTIQCTLPQPLPKTQLPLIEQEARTVVQEEPEIVTREMIGANAADYLKHLKQPLLAELLAEQPKELVTLIEIGDFINICPLPHITSTKDVGIIALMASSETDGITHITGTNFPSKKELKRFLKQWERAKKHNHLTLGQTMGWFQPVDKDAWAWLPRGEQARELLRKWWKKQIETEGFHLVRTPGNSFKTKISQHQQLSCQETALAELGATQNEDSGTDPIAPLECEADLLTIKCNKSSIKSQLTSSLQFLEKMTKLLGFEWIKVLDLRRRPGVPNRPERQQSAKWLSEAVKVAEIETEPVEEHLSPPELGPELQWWIQDALGRRWLGARLGVTTDLSTKDEGTTLHLQVIGSVEQLLALILEKTEGCLPTWLISEQVRLIPVSEKQHDLAREVGRQLELAEVRWTTDMTKQGLGARIHLAQKEQIPYTVVLGEKEEKEGQLSVRKRGEQQSFPMTVAELAEIVSLGA